MEVIREGENFYLVDGKKRYTINKRLSVAKQPTASLGKVLAAVKETSREEKYWEDLEDTQPVVARRDRLGVLADAILKAARDEPRIPVESNLYAMNVELADLAMKVCKEMRKQDSGDFDRHGRAYVEETMVFLRCLNRMESRGPEQLERLSNAYDRGFFISRELGSPVQEFLTRRGHIAVFKLMEDRRALYVFTESELYTDLMARKAAK